MIYLAKERLWPVDGLERIGPSWNVPRRRLKVNGGFEVSLCLKNISDQIHRDCKTSRMKGSNLRENSETLVKPPLFHYLITLPPVRSALGLSDKMNDSSTGRYSEWPRYSLRVSRISTDSDTHTHICPAVWIKDRI